MTVVAPAPHGPESLGDQLKKIIDALPPDSIRLQVLVDVFGDEGLLLLTALLTLVFLIPVSIPGVSTVFGAAILLIGLSRLTGRPLWLPSRLREKVLPVARLRPGLETSLVWMHRMERISRPHRLPRLVDNGPLRLVNDAAFILAALLLMAPFGLIPFSNTLPALALLLYAVGFIQRDGGAVLLGHAANIGSLVYFGVLIGSGGLAVNELMQRVGL
jgi:hypothetical protein